MPVTLERHPLLTLRPAERRVLLRHLVERDSVLRAEATSLCRRRLSVALVWYGCCLMGLFVPLLTRVPSLHQAAGFAVGLACILLALQLALGWLLGRLAPGRFRSLQRFLTLPAVPWRAMTGRLGPQGVPASHFVLVAGLLLTARPHLSRTLAERLVGRMAGVPAVRRAIDWLVVAGYLVPTGFSSSVLGLTLEARRLLQALNVPLEVTTSPIEMAMPVHLLPLLEPPVETDTREDVAEEPPRVGSVFAKAQTTLALTAVPRPPARGSKRLLWLLIVSAALLGGGWAAWKAGAFALGSAAAPKAMALQTRRLPHSRGRALQLNAQGLMLSTFGGHLYLSLPERLDYKEPWTFTGFDMAADCALVHPRVQRALLAPLGRFLWVESANQAGNASVERCLVDIETRTVSHSWDARARWPRPGHVLGWLNAHTLLVVNLTDAGHRPSGWMAWDVLTARGRSISLPAAEWLVPLESQAGLVTLAELKGRPGSAWGVRLWHWRDGGGFEASRDSTALPVELAAGVEPVQGAISRDRRMLLLAWRTPGARSGDGLLTILPLTDGVPVAVPVQSDFRSEAPVFWGEDDRPGHYRFYYHTRSERGLEPWAADVVLQEDASRQASSAPWSSGLVAWRRLLESARL